MSVRASTRSYTRFTLAMDSSPGFGSTATNSQRPFGLGFPPAPGIAPLALLATVTRRFVLQKARDYARAYTPTRSRSVSAHGFRISFTPLDGVLFTIPSRYFSLSVARGIQPWRVVPPASNGISRVPPYSRVPT